MKLNLPSSSVSPASSDAGSLPVAEIVDQAPALVKTTEGLTKLERLLEKSFPQEKIVGYIQDLCEAEDIKMDKQGEEFRSPNWDARKNGLDRVLELLRYKKKGEPMKGDGAPIKIIFNVQNPTVTVEKP